jgi:hypothetical protein
MTLFFDRNLGHKVPDALLLLGLPVTKHDDRFTQGATDEEWLQEVGQQGWVVVTRDEKLWWNASALKALSDHRLGCFVLSGAGDRPRWYAVRILARNWDTVERLASGEERPFLCRLRLRQSVELKQLAAR